MFYFISVHSKAILHTHTHTHTRPPPPPSPPLPQQQKAGAENAQSYQAAAGVAGGVDVRQPAVADLVTSTLEYAHPRCVLGHGLLLHRQGRVGVLHVLPARVGQGHLSQRTHTPVTENTHTCHREHTHTCHREHTHLSQRTHTPVRDGVQTSVTYNTDTCHI